MIRFLIALCFVSILCVSCYYDSEEYIYPQIGCDTLNVTYSTSVVPILSDLCISCHSGSSSVKLDTYADVKLRVENGSLLGSIKHESGFQAMPQGGAKLDDCRIAVISKWFENGAQNN